MPVLQDSYFNHLPYIVIKVSNAITRNTEVITIAAITFSFCNNVLIFFIHKSFSFEKGFKDPHGIWNEKQ